MSANLTLPASLVDDLSEGASRDGLSLQGHVNLVLGIVSAMLDPSRNSPEHHSLEAFFADRSLDVDLVAETFREILRYVGATAAKWQDLGDDSMTFRDFLASEANQGLREVALFLRERCGVDPELPPKIARPSVRGKYANLPFSSDDFAREKEEEFEREELRRR